VRKRVRWLNENAGLSQDLNYQKVSEAAIGVDMKTVMDILKDVEEKKDKVKDPTAYVTTGLRKRGGGQHGGGGMYDAPPPMHNWGAAPAPGGWNPEAEAEDKKLRRRIGWLNKDGGFNGALIYDKVLEAAGGLEFSEVFKILKEVEEKKDTLQIRDPNAWVCNGLKRKASSSVGAGPPRGMMQAWGPPPGMPFPGPAPGYGNFAGGMDSETNSKLHKRIKWLNGTGGFNDSIVFDKVKEAAEGVDPVSMMKVLKDLEEKKDTVKDPTAYVSSALRKMGGGGGRGRPGVPGVRRTINKVKHEV